MGLTRNDKQRIQELQENFETDENLADSDRMYLGSKIAGLMSYYETKYKSYGDLTELDGDMAKDYAEYKALYTFLQDIHEKYIQLDNNRCHNIARLCGLLSYTDLELTDKIKKYEW